MKRLLFTGLLFLTASPLINAQPDEQEKKAAQYAVLFFLTGLLKQI